MQLRPGENRLVMAATGSSRSIQQRNGSDTSLHTSKGTSKGIRGLTGQQKQLHKQPYSNSMSAGAESRVLGCSPSDADFQSIDQSAATGLRYGAVVPVE